MQHYAGFNGWNIRGLDHTVNSSRTHFWLQFQVADLFRKPTGSDYFQGE
jgi:hypothetical protein